MMSGFTLLRSSYPSPRRSIVPTLKFSVTTSAWRTSCLKSSIPVGVLSSSVMPSLLRSRYCAAGTRSSTPWRLRFTPSDTRSRPRSRDSTLITFAPRSASSMVQKGMAMTCPRSSTVTSLSACSMGVSGPHARGNDHDAVVHQGDADDLSRREYGLHVAPHGEELAELADERVFDHGAKIRDLRDRRLQPSRARRSHDDRFR